MRRLSRVIARALRRHPALAACAAFAAAGFLPLSGCMGGSSTEVGNPLSLVFYQDGKRVEFDGYIRLVAAGSNPEFYYAYPEDGTTPPVVAFEPGAGSVPLRQSASDSIVLERETIESSLYLREQLRLRKAAAGGARMGALPADTLPDFNIILQASGSGDPGKIPGAWLANVHSWDRGYSTPSGDSGRVFEIELTPGHRCTGEVDTTAEAGPPLALFVPGSPYYALVEEGRFEFVGLPAGRLPLRWVTRDGRVFSVPESLGVAGGGPTPAEYTFPGPVHAGERLDSIPMPTPYPTLPKPAAEPAGPWYFSDSVVVSLSAPAGAVIRYTTDDSTPQHQWKKYAKPLVLRLSTTLRAMAIAPGSNPSPVATNNYVLAPARPVLSPPAGRFQDSVVVSLAGPAGSTLHYTVDGTAPTQASPIYRGALTLRETAVVQAIAVIPGLGSSSAASAEYVIETAPPAHPGM